MKNGEMVLHGQFDVLTKNVYSAVEPDQPFANHHWFYGVVIFILQAVVGWGGLVLFKVLVLVGTLALLIYTASKKANFWVAAVCAAPLILILFSRAALRPEMFSYALVAVYLFVLMDLESRPDRKWLYWLIPLQLFWVNVHLFFPVGLMLVGGLLFEKLLLLRRHFLGNTVVKKLGIVFLSLCLVTFINPYGLLGVIFSLKVNTDVDFPVASAEIDSIFNILAADPTWGNVSAKLYFPAVISLAISFILVFGLRWRRKQFLFADNYIFFFLASLGSALLSAVVIRGLPLFGIVFFLALAINLNEITQAYKMFVAPRWPKFYNTGLSFGFAVIIAMYIGIIIFGQRTLLRYTEQGLGLANWSEASADFYARQGLRGPVFNDTDIGSYLIYYLFPEDRVFTDNRFGDAYSSEFFSETYLPMMRDEEAWKRGLETYNFNTIYFYHYDAVAGARDFIYRRIYDPDWAWVYVDSYVVILVRNTPDNQEIINKFQITPDNLYDKVSYLLESPVSGDNVAGADILSLVGRIDLATEEYLKIVLREPDRGKVWMVLGRTELTKADYENSDPFVAAVYLERAVEEGWGTWETYSYLALAYYRIGDLDSAEAAAAKELKLAPDNPDAIQWQEVLAEARALEVLE